MGTLLVRKDGTTGNLRKLLETLKYHLKDYHRVFISQHFVLCFVTVKSVTYFAESLERAWGSP